MYFYHNTEKTYFPGLCFRKIFDKDNGIGTKVWDELLSEEYVYVMSNVGIHQVHTFSGVWVRSLYQENPGV